MRRDGPAIGGFVPFSSVDWPGRLSAVVFIKGCPWRCHYCHNPHLQSRQDARVIEIANQHPDTGMTWERILQFLETRKSLLDGVVFTGGEPLSEPNLPEMIRQVVDMGFETAAHTAGMYPSKLHGMMKALTWVGLDIKTDEAGYDALTGRSGSAESAWRSLDVLLDGDVPFECRTTWSPEWLSETALIDLAQGLSLKGVRKYAIQRYRSLANRNVGAELSSGSLQIMSGLFEQFSYR